MSRVKGEDIIELLRTLVSFRTVNPPGNEEILAEFLIDRLTASPVEFHVEIHEVDPRRPNIVARAGDPANGSLLFNGHMDVVPVEENKWTGNPFELRHEENQLIGRGTADMKGALAAGLLAAEEFLMNTEDPGEVILTFVMNEERGGTGTEALVKEQDIDADAAIVGEPTQVRPAIAEYGQVAYTVTTYGKSAHSGRPDKGVNAIGAMKSVLDRIDKLAEEVQNNEHELLEPGPSISVTEIHGGIAPNIIPNEATIDLIWRIHPASSNRADVFDQRLEKTLDEAELNGEPIEYEYDRWMFARGTEIQPEEPIVQAILETGKTIGHSVEIVGFNAGSDARWLIHEAEIPTVLLGPGSIESDAHTVDESIDRDSLVTTYEIYRGTLEQLLGG